MILSFVRRKQSPRASPRPWATCWVPFRAANPRRPSLVTVVIDAILDTGPLVGSLDRDDQWHRWAATQFAAIQQPALTCEAVISEACFLLRESPDARQKIFTLVERGVLRIVSVLPDESPSIRV